MAIAVVLSSQPAQPVTPALRLAASTSGTSSDPTNPCDNLYVSSGDFNNPHTVTGNTVVQRDLKDSCLLEQEVVTKIVADRGMSDTAAARQEVMTYGRDAVRAGLYLRLMNLAKQDLDNRNDPSHAKPLTATEQGGLNWFKKQLAFQNLQIAKDAQAEYNAWDANKCTWQPPSGSGVTYSTLGSDCQQGVNGLWTGDPIPPSLKQFVTIGQWDFLHSVDSSTDLSTTMVATSANLAVALSAIAGGVAFAGLSGGFVLTTLFTTTVGSVIMPYAALAGAGAGVGISGVIVLAAALLVILAIVGGTAATIARIIQLADAAALPDKLQQLVDDASAKEVDPTKVSLDDYVSSTVTADQTQFLYLAYVLATLPRHAPIAGALPTATPDPAPAAPWFKLTQGGQTTQAQSFLSSIGGTVYRVSLNHDWWVLVPQDGGSRLLDPVLTDPYYGGASAAAGLIGYATGGSYGSGAFTVQKTKNADGSTPTALGTKASSFTIAAPPLSDPSDGKAADAQALKVALTPEPTATLSGVSVSPTSLHAGKTAKISGSSQYAASVKVDFGDGTATTTLTPAADGSFSTTHEYDTEGTWSPTVTAYSRTGVAGNVSTKSIQVLAELPATVDTLSPVSGNEGDTLTVSGTTTDAAKVSIDFGDGSAAKVLDVTGDAFSVDHTYVDNVTGSVTVTPVSPLGKDGTPVSATLDIANVAPSLGSLALSLADGSSDPVTVTPVPDTGATPSDTVRLMIPFTDPGVLDTHTATVDWGDGTTQTDVPITSGGYVDHVYDGSVADGPTTVTVTVADNGGGVSNVATADLRVDGKPQITKAPKTVHVKEGSKLTISGLVTDGVLSGGHVAARWHDGSHSKSAVTPVAPFTGDFSLSHIYADNKPGNAPYKVRLSPTDTDNLTGATQYVNVVVRNVAPSMVWRIITPANRSKSIIRPYEPVILKMVFSDPGVLDTHTVTVDWGDGTSTPAKSLGLARGAVLKHTYLHLYGGTYPVTFTVTDNDGASTTSTLSAVVHPASPRQVKSRRWRKGLRLGVSAVELDKASAIMPALSISRDAAVLSLLRLVQKSHANLSPSLAAWKEHKYHQSLSAANRAIAAGNTAPAVDHLLMALRIVVG